MLGNQKRDFGRTRGGIGRDTSGATALFVALSLLPMMMVIGLAFDTSRLRSARNALSASIDTTVIAGVRAMLIPTNSDAEVLAYATDVFRANILAAHGDIACSGDPAFVMDREAFSMRITASCSVPTTFAALVGVNSFDFAESATAIRGENRLDLAMMVDVSGSMSGSRIAALRTAAKQAVDILIDDTTEDRVRIGLAPYADAVNAGVYGPLSADPDEFDDDDDDDDDAWDPLVPFCVSEREDDGAKTDVAPGEDLLGPGNDTWVGLEASTCPQRPIFPITSDSDAIKAQIDAMTTGGSTAGHLGIEWSWYLISPNWSGVWPSANRPHDYSDTNTIKAVILMTDGAFNKRYDNSQGNSPEQAREICENMRDAGVQIYSVAFQAPAAGESVLRDCAASPSRFFNASSAAELNDAYADIAASLNQLRLTE